MNNYELIYVNIITINFGYRLSKVSVLTDVLRRYLCLLLTGSCPVKVFDFSLCPSAVRWWLHILSLRDKVFHLIVDRVYR